MSPSELASFIRDDLACGQEIVFAGQSIEIRPNMPAVELDQAIRELAREIGLEELRTWVECKADAIAGLITLLALRHRLPDHDPAPRGWREMIIERSAWQPSVLQLMFQIEEFLAEEPTVADLMEWIVVHRIIDVHESVAYGKLPEFTFRFRHEIGLLRFYDTDPSRFGVTDIRRDAICRLTEDLGLWSSEGGIPSLTPEGEEFVGRVFG